MFNLRARKGLAWAMAVVFSCAAGAAAQEPGASATIQGRVVNPQGDGVAAQVRVVGVGTGFSRETRADAAGHFAITSIRPGEVTLIITAPGFADWRGEGVRLEVGQVARIDVRLTIAPVREQVEVQAGAGTVELVTSSVGSVISADEIKTLPLNGRNFLELAFLTPGNSPTATFDPTKAQSVAVSSAGQLGRGGNVTIDGMDNNDDVVGGPLQNIPEDAVQEFRITTNRSRPSSASRLRSVINVVTRSGGSRVSGSSAIYLRDSALAGAAGHHRPDLAGKPPFRRQQASFTLGGPISGTGSSGSGPWRSATRTAACWSACATRPPGRLTTRSRRRRSTTCSAMRASTGGVAIRIR